MTNALCILPTSKKECKSDRKLSNCTKPDINKHKKFLTSFNLFMKYLNDDGINIQGTQSKENITVMYLSQYE